MEGREVLDVWGGESVLKKEAEDPIYTLAQVIPGLD